MSRVYRFKLRSVLEKFFPGEFLIDHTYSDGVISFIVGDSPNRLSFTRAFYTGHSEMGIYRRLQSSCLQRFMREECRKELLFDTDAEMVSLLSEYA